MVGGGRRRGARWLAAWLVLLGCWTALRWVDAPGPAPIVQALLVPVALTLPVLLALALLRGRRAVAAGSLGLAVLLGYVAAPWFGGPRLGRAEGDVVVAAANLQFGGGDLGEVEALVREERVDVLVLLEATSATDEWLDGSRIEQLLPHRSGESAPDASGTLVLTREPHDQLAGPEGTGFDQVAVEVDGLTVVGAHTFPPLMLSSQRWRTELALLERWLTGVEGPLVVAGDLNASTGHPALRDLMRTNGLLDAHQVAGRGWVRSWHVGSVAPGFVHIDHVLVRGRPVADAGTATVEGADHLAVWARIAPPR